MNSELKITIDDLDTFNEMTTVMDGCISIPAGSVLLVSDESYSLPQHYAWKRVLTSHGLRWAVSVSLYFRTVSL